MPQNNPLDSLLRKIRVARYEVANGVYCRGGTPALMLKADTPIFFDFRDSRYTHFGDLLFFVPLLLCLSRRFPVTCLATGQHKAILAFMLPVAHTPVALMEAPPPSLWNDRDRPALVVTTPYLLAGAAYPAHLAVVGLGMPSAPVGEPYPEFLASAFLRQVAVDEGSPGDIAATTLRWTGDLKRRIAHEAARLDRSLPDHCIWLAPYLGSGRFRDFLKTKQRRLLSTAEKMARREGATLILAGGRNDPPVRIHEASLLDMRGNDIVHMVCLAGSPRVRRGIGFDGFWMHVFDMLGKPFDVLFRGRLTPLGRDLHDRSVNVSFLKGGTRNYL